MTKSNLFSLKTIILIVVIILLLISMYNCIYIYKLNYIYSKYFTQEINNRIRQMKNHIDKNTEILNEVIKKKQISQEEWNILFNGYKTLHSNISYLKSIIKYTRIDSYKKYKIEANHISPYAKYYNYFLTSNIRFEFKNKSTINLNEDDINYYNTMFNFTNKYLDILIKYDDIKIYVNDDYWIHLINEINKISF